MLWPVIHRFRFNLWAQFVPYAPNPYGMALWVELAVGLAVGPPWLAQQVARGLDARLKSPRARAMVSLPFTLGPVRDVTWPGLCAFAALSIWSAIPGMALIAALRGTLPLGDRDFAMAILVQGALGIFVASAGAGLFVIRRTGRMPAQDALWRLRGACLLYSAAMGLVTTFGKDGPHTDVGGYLVSLIVMVPCLMLPGIGLGLAPGLLRPVARRLGLGVLPREETAVTTRAG